MTVFAVPALNNGVNLNAPTADGTDGQVVTTDGAGNLSFSSASGGGTSDYTTTNKDSVSIQAGQAVAAFNSSGIGVVRGNATNDQVQCVGLAIALAAANAAITIQTNGLLTLADWTNVIGSTTLTTKTKYWLDVTAGKLTATPPSTVGNIVQLIGEAVTDTTLSIDIQQAVKL